MKCFRRMAAMSYKVNARQLYTPLLSAFEEEILIKKTERQILPLCFFLYSHKVFYFTIITFTVFLTAPEVISTR